MAVTLDDCMVWGVTRVVTNPLGGPVAQASDNIWYQSEDNFRNFMAQQKGVIATLAENTPPDELPALCEMLPDLLRTAIVPDLVRRVEINNYIKNGTPFNIPRFGDFIAQREEIDGQLSGMVYDYDMYTDIPEWAALNPDETGFLVIAPVNPDLPISTNYFTAPATPEDFPVPVTLPAVTLTGGDYTATFFSRGTSCAIAGSEAYGDECSIFPQGVTTEVTRITGLNVENTVLYLMPDICGLPPEPPVTGTRTGFVYPDGETEKINWTFPPMYSRIPFQNYSFAVPGITRFKGK